MVTRRLPAGTRIYAVGDVHGHADKLMAMHHAIRADLQRDPAPDPVLIHLGDYIDRGPDSAGCVSMLARAAPIRGMRAVNLMGNHEWMLLNAIDGATPEAAALYLENGGDMALESWNLPRTARPAQWAAAIPAAQMAFLRGLSLHHREGDYLFAHAGVRPGTPLAAQTRTDLLWIREAFLEWNGPMLPEQPDTLVVHGHTPVSAPTVRRYRIGIDTNAARGGPLTCVILGPDEPRFIQV